MSQVLDELGLNLSDELSSELLVLALPLLSPPLLSRFLHHFLSLPDLPSTGGTLSAGAGKKAEPQAAVADADADLEERLNNLRRD